MSTQKGLPQQSKSSINPLETLSRPSHGQDDLRQHESPSASQKPREFANPEFRSIFSRDSHVRSEQQVQRIQEVQSILQEIRREVTSIKAQNQALAAEIEQIDRTALQGIPEKVGVYHVRYFEILLHYLRNMNTKIGEARTWLMAMTSKKRKRGGAFADRSQEQGTSYSLSAELQAARNVS